MKDIRIVYMYNHYNIRLSVYCENIHVHVFRELFQPLVCYILHVPTIYSDGATYSTLALLSSILWVRSPCFPD